MAQEVSPLTGQPIPRVEDPKLIQGQGLYVSDVQFEHQWVMALVRSAHAHAVIQHIDTQAAKKVPGVHAVITAQDLPDLKRPLVGMEPLAPPVLAYDRVHYAGQPIVAILADSRYQAEDAADLVEITYDPLAAVIDPEEAARDTQILHPNFGTNILDTYEIVAGQGEAALQQADHVVTARLRMGRVSAQPMEPRSVAARYNPDSDSLLVYDSTQAVHRAQDRIAAFLGMPKTAVRVIAPEVGGGFGVKNGSYPEEALVCYLARHVGHPVKWSGDRFEEFFGTYQEREQVHDVTLGLTRDGVIVALVDRFYQDNGAFPGGGIMVAQNTARNIPGPYRVPHMAITGYTVMTNKLPQAPYRGAGRPQGHYVIERILDRAADELDFDRAALKMKNLVQPADFPYTTAAKHVLDSGDYPRVFQDLIDLIDLPAFRKRQQEALERGVRLGLGLSNCVEISAGFGFEGARVTLKPSGQIVVTTGATNQGQGHRTALAQIAADSLGVDLDQVTVVEGDTGQIDRSIGTFGSRTIIMAGNAIKRASQKFMDQMREAAARLLEAHVQDVHYEGGRFFVQGVPSLALDWPTIAAKLAESGPLPQDEDYYDLNSSTYGFGAHAVIVEVDEATAAIRIDQYVIMHDSGTVVNPLLANGQVVGGAVQGLGSAMFEEMLFSPDGQPLTTSFLDYRLPSAPEMPDFEVHHRDFPSPNNPGGYKGVGEAGIIPSQAIILSAVEDAFRDRRLYLNYAPVTPPRLFEALNEGGNAS